MQIQKILSKPVYPFLFIAYYFLHFYAHNMPTHPDLGPIAGVFLAASGLLGMGWLLLNLKLKDAQRSGLLSGLLAFAVLTGGHVQTVMEEQKFLIQAAVWFSMVFVCAFVIWEFRQNRRGVISGLTKYLNLTVGLLVCFSLFNITSYHFKNSKAFREIRSNPAVSAQEIFAVSAKPDIYVLVLDEYARADILKKYFGFDNTDFIKELEARGFYVAKKSRGNYYMTKLCLAALLNWQYLDFLPQIVGGASKDTFLIEAMTRQSNITTKLKSQGYKYVLLNSGSPPTDRSRLADIWINYGVSEELRSTLAQGTLLRSVVSKVMDKEHRNRFHYSFNELKKIPDVPEPTFTLAHIMAPHAPYIFDRNGDALSTETFSLKAGQKEGEIYSSLYIEQMIYLNRRVLDLVDTLLQKSSEPPIIVIQADHGYRAETTKESTPEFLLPASGILNALYIPGVAKEKFYETMTPVNTFPFIFREYFKAQAELLPDRSVFSNWDETPYEFQDVTELLDKAETEMIEDVRL